MKKNFLFIIFIFFNFSYAFGDLIKPNIEIEPKKVVKIQLSALMKNNNPYKEHHHPRYTPLIKVPDNEVMDYTNKTTNSDEHFLRKDNVDQDWAKNK